MRKLSIIIGAAVLVAACAFGKPNSLTVSVATGTNTSGSAAAQIAGYVDEIVLALPTGTAVTGTVAVVATQPMGNTVTLASKEITATTLIRPRLDGTDTAGSALTGDPPGRYMSYGDNFAVTVTDANVTGKTWSVWIKYDDMR